MDLSGLKEIVRDLTQSAEQRAVARALKHYSKGQIDKAIETLIEARDKSPENADILFELARLFVLADRGGEAAEALRTILRRDPRAFQRAAEMIEELRARRARVGPLYEAIADHFVRLEDLPHALEAMERIDPQELRATLARHRGKWDTLRKSAPEAKLAKPSLHSAYFLALGSEVQRDFEMAGTIYRTIAGHNTEEMPRVLARLQALLARDYHNSSLRVAVADLCVLAGRMDEAVQQFGIALETDTRLGGGIADRIEAAMKETGEHPELRWTLTSAALAAGDARRALAAIRPLIEGGLLLDRAGPVLEKMAENDPSGEARGLLATAMMRRGQGHAALETLLPIAEEKGLAAIRGPLEALAAATPGSARACHMLADLHLSEGDTTRAVEYLRQAATLAPGESAILVPRLIQVLQKDPAAGEAHLLLSDRLLDSNERDRAVVVLRHLVREAPGAAAEALTRIAALLKVDPRAAHVRMAAAEACLELRRFPEALDHLAELAASHPQLAAEFLHSFCLLAEAAPDLHDRIAAALRTLEPRCPLPQAARFAIAESLFFGGDAAGAAAAFGQVLRDAPDQAETVRAALERFDRDQPQAAEARGLLACLHLDRQDHAAALAELARGGAPHPALLDQVLAKYEALVSTRPDDLEARCAWVEALRLGGRFDRVLEVGAEILKVRDDAGTARVSLAIGDAQRHRGDTDGAAKRWFAAYGRDPALANDAIARLRELAAAEGTQAIASLALGKILAGEKRSTEATEALRAAAAAEPKLRETVIAELERLQASSPGDPQPGLALLAMLHDGGDRPRALKVISGLLDAHPDLASVLAGHLEAVLKTDPQQPFATYELGRALQRLKFFPRSAALYLAAFRLDEGLAPMILKRLQECVDAAPTCPEPYLAACAVLAARGKFQAAAEKIQQALLKMPDESARLLPRLEEIGRQNRGNPTLQMVIAQAALRAEQYERALAAFGEAARGDPALTDAAFEGFEAIVGARPDLGAAWLERGRAHARRLRLDLALVDLQRAAQVDPGLAPEVLQEAQELRTRLPESCACLLLVADLLAAAGRDTESQAALRAEKDAGWSPTERLAILVRLWRLAAARQEDDEAQACLAEARRLAPDPNLLLARVHETYVTMLRASTRRLRSAGEHDSRRGADTEAVIRALVDLGDLDQAADILQERAGTLDRRQASRLRGEIALRRGDYSRALEHLREVGATRLLAFGAVRGGDPALAARTLETLLKENEDPALRAALARAYRDLMIADLNGGRQRLQGETQVTFLENQAA